MQEFVCTPSCPTGLPYQVAGKRVQSAGWVLQLAGRELTPLRVKLQAARLNSQRAEGAQLLDRHICLLPPPPPHLRPAEEAAQAWG